jgi:SAM-dependent methyltransferase
MNKFTLRIAVDTNFYLLLCNESAMIVKKPYNKNNLHIKKSYRVLDVGPGNDPTRRANVLVDKFLFDDSQRHGSLRVFPHQVLVEGAGENLPFKDNEFDYVISTHVLEHAEDPELFLKEMFRVAKRGYIETPSLIGEIFSPKASHRWVLLLIDNKLLIYDKSKIPHGFNPIVGGLFSAYLPYYSLPFRLFVMYRNNLQNVKIEWRDNFEFIVNPEQPEYKKYFTTIWTQEMVNKLFPPFPIGKELLLTFKAFIWFLKDKIKRMIFPQEDSIVYHD